MNSQAGRMMAGMCQGGIPAFDVGIAIDQSRWTGWQKRATMLAALAITADGFDNQSLSFVVPQLIGEWGLPRDSFAPVLASSLIGVSIGTISGGWASDRLGRRPLLIFGTVVFAIMSMLMSLCSNLPSLLLARLVASIGMGCVMPTAIALVAEYSPPRVRTLALSATVICLPLGGMLSGLAASVMLPAVGWRAFFLFGGVLALTVALLMWLLLPESLRYLSRVPVRWAEATRLAARMQINIPDGAPLFDSTERPHVRTSLVVLLGPELRRRTLTLSLAYATGLFCMQLSISWLPTLLASLRFSLATASLGLSAFNFGGVLGSIAFGFIGLAAGTRVSAAVALCGAGMVAISLALMRIAPDGAQAQMLVAMLALHGAFAHASQTLLAALGAQVFPTGVRATGAGATIAVGRICAALSSAWLGVSLVGLGARPFFLTIAGSCVATAAVLMLLDAASSGQVERER
jgi:MFS transporter, AAHS family, 4-hydroxybenzoate transporter